jgi:hypothetical protein
MLINCKTFAGTFGALVLTLLLVPNASAGCGSIDRPPLPFHSNFHSQLGQARVLSVALTNISDHEDGIVGFWHVKFVSKDSPGVPDGTEIDAGYSQWHSDGTEIMNSGGRSPITSNFCLGVWERVGECQYKLNHFATSWDPTGSKLVGPVRIAEDVTLKNKNEFSGTFAIDVYDESGNSLAHLQGMITGTRIDPSTPATSIF